VSLVGGGQVVQFKPASTLPANHNFSLILQFLTNTDGVAAQNAFPNFTTGTASDSTAPPLFRLGRRMRQQAWVSMPLS